MEGVLHYNLPEEEQDFKLAQRGKDYFKFLWDLDQELRNWLKYGHNFKSPNKVMEKIREELREVEIWDIA